MRLRVRTEISEAGRARFDTVVTDLSSHSQPNFINTLYLIKMEKGTPTLVKSMKIFQQD